MAECERCGAFTNAPAEKDYHYCSGCQDYFAAIQRHGIVVEDRENGGVHVSVTAHEESLDGGVEQSQVDGLARGKHLSNETGLPAMFIYERSGSRWDLEEYLSAHPSIDKRVRDRLRRVPDRERDNGLLSRLQNLLGN